MSVTLIQETGQGTALSQALSDLDMSKILCRIDPRMTPGDADHFMRRYFSSDAGEIKERLAVLMDLKQVTDAARLQHAIDAILSIQREQEKLNLAAGKLQEVLYRWRLASAYTACLQEWSQLLDTPPHPYESERIQALQQFFTRLTEEPFYAHCQSAIKELEELLCLPRYLHLGINLREDGYPSELGILSLENDAEELNALLCHTDAAQPSHGLGPEFVYNRSLYGSHFDEYILRGLEKQWKSEINKASKLVGGLRFTHSDELLALVRPLQFYQIALLSAEAFEQRGYLLCRPEPLPGASLEMQAVVYPDLVLHSSGIQGNDLRLQKGNAVIITGANHSGKTSYLKTIGQSYVLAQLGFLVPAAAMRFSPVTSIFTLFSAGEDSSMTASRMGVEIKKLTTILKEAAASDLVLLNEPMTSTNPVEAVSICADLSRHFLEKGITHLLVTHLYDIYFLLKAQLPAAHRQHLESLITQSAYDEASQSMQHSYHLISAEPLGNSYARETAAAYRITLQDMLPAGDLLTQASAYCELHNINSIYEGDDSHGLSDNH
ncbi:MAG: hypothetical protein HFE64_08850 [Lachnospiraceae bacterium]|nr:hypothetical protein [Lachnospiraceae bacterium]